MRNKNKILGLAFAAILIISFLTFQSIAVSAEAWLEGYTYRRAVTITEQSGNTLTNYTVKIVLNTSIFDYSKAKDDGSDLRFTLDDGVTTIPYWIESWNPGGESVIWVKVPEISANGEKTIYMYYGNPGAVSQSNATATFQIYETFDVLDTDLWELLGRTDLITVVDGELRIVGDFNADEYAKINYTKKFELPVEVEYYVKIITSGDNLFCAKYPIAVDSYNDRFITLYYEFGAFYLITWSSGEGTNTVASASAATDVYYKIKVLITATYINAVIYDDSGSVILNGTYNVVGALTLKTFSLAAENKNGAVYTIAFHADNVVAKKYAEKEPSVLIGEEQFNEGEQGAESLHITLETDKLAYNESETITVTAYLLNGSEYLSNELIIFEYRDIAKTATTDETGKAQVTFTAEGSGEQTIVAYLAENETIRASAKFFVICDNSIDDNTVLFSFTIKNLDPGTKFDVEVYTEKNLRSDVKVYEARNLTGAAFSFSFDFGSLDEITLRIYLKVHESYTIANKTVLQDKDYFVRRTYKLSDAENGVINDEIELTTTGLVAGEAARKLTLVIIGGVGVFAFIALILFTGNKRRYRRRR